jgi:hypothetical protein
MRRPIAVAFVFAALLGSVAVEETHAFLPSYTQEGVDLDFQNGSYWQGGSTKSAVAANFITTVRASTGYANDTLGNWTSFANNVARITNKGLLVEEARTNSIRNNSGTGAVVGTPGTLPTNWSVLNSIGLTTNVIGTGTENGIDYVDLQVTGNTNGAVAYRIGFETNVGIAAVQNNIFSGQAFVRLVGGDFTNINTAGFGFWSLNSAHTILTTYESAITLPTAAALGTQRFKVENKTVTDATAANVLPLIEFNPPASVVAVNFTIRIGWPTLEGTSATFATSPIRTTNAVVTRNADVVTLTTVPAFGSAYTLFGKGTTNAPVGSTFNALLEVDQNNNTDRTILYRNSVASNASTLTAVANVSQFGVTSGPLLAASVSQKMAVGIAIGSAAFVVNNGTPSTGSPGSVPTPTVVRIGTDGNSGIPWNGPIERAVLWPTVRLSNPVLQQMTNASTAANDDGPLYAANDNILPHDIPKRQIWAEAR